MPYLISIFYAQTAGVGAGRETVRVTPCEVIAVRHMVREIINEWSDTYSGKAKGLRGIQRSLDVTFRAARCDTLDSSADEDFTGAKDRKVSIRSGGNARLGASYGGEFEIKLSRGVSTV